MIVTVVAATNVSRCLTTLLHFGTLFILTQDGSRTLFTTAGVEHCEHTTQPGPCCMELCSPTTLQTGFVTSAPHYLFLWDSSHHLPRTLNLPLLPSKLEHLAVKQHSSTFQKTQAVKIWSILSQGVFCWLAWGWLDSFDPAGSLQIWILPALTIWNKVYLQRWEQTGRRNHCENMNSQSLFWSDKHCLKIRWQGGKPTLGLHSSIANFLGRASETEILWKSAGVCQLIDLLVGAGEQKGCIKARRIWIPGRVTRLHCVPQEWWGESQEVGCKLSGFLHWGLAKNLTPLFAWERSCSAFSVCKGPHTTAVSCKCAVRALLSKCHESTLAQATQEKVSPPVFTGGLSVIYGCLEVYFARKCNLLLSFRVTAWRAIFRTTQGCVLCQHRKKVSWHTASHHGLHYRYISWSWWATEGHFLAGWHFAQPQNCHHKGLFFKWWWFFKSLS